MKRLSFLSTVVALLLGSIFITTPLVAAQTMSGPLPGITVVGLGEASAPAETATIVIMLGAGYDYKDPAAMEKPGIWPSSGASAEDSVGPVIDALVAAGVPAEEIELVSNPYSGDYGPYGGPTQATLRFTLTDPTTERISEVLDAALAAAMDAGMFVNMTSALYGVADCAQLVREARGAAIEDARGQAGLQAELLDVSLGDVTASRDNPINAMAYSGVYAGSPVFNSCTLGGEVDTINALYSAPPFDPSVAPEVSIQATTELTFEIVRNESATPGT
jgi:uncharacterized protein YggE